MRYHLGDRSAPASFSRAGVVLLGLVLAASPALAAGTTKVTGTVTDADGKPVIGVVVQFESLTVKGKKIPPTKTNKKGEFSYPFLDLTSGNEFRVYPQHPDYLVLRVRYVSVDSFGNKRDEGEKTLDDKQNFPGIKFSLIGQGTAIVGRNEVHFTVVPRAAFPAALQKLLAERQAASQSEEAAEAHRREDAERRKKEEKIQSFDLAVQAASQGRHEEAVAAFRGYLEAEPDHDQARYELAKSLMELGRVEEAGAEFRRALEANPDLAGAHFHLGLLYARQGRYSEAEAEFRRELELSPEEAPVLFNLALSLQEQDKGGEAIPLLEKVTELDPENAEVHWRLGKLYEARGDPARATAEYQKLAEANPERAARIFFNLGQEAFRRRDREDAAAAYRKAIEVDPEYADAHRQLGYCLVGMGEFGSAVEHFRRFLELEPNSPQAQEIRDTIAQLTK